MMPTMTYEPSRLRAHRDGSGMSRRTFIREAGLDITTETLRCWELGKYQPRADQLAAMAGALGITVQDFFSEAS